ncbi:HAD family hydrolase [Rhizobium sp. BK060]|uniref:HAD family hydrolase n=1 Tax=Rhizobium sp. BK060 TaxID=2587096 RepID=UPI00161D6307|nr:HAD family hydrolase [Rhizobium sp. BK060]MBB3396201.1 phosphoglycolate phosphatase-like HAD superfamily hydrolase [Rhizobium sp. BK060]
MLTIDFKKLPEAIIFDFDGVILDTARSKTDAFALCYQGESEEKIRQVIDYQERHGGIGRKQKFEYFEAHVFGRRVDAHRIELLCERFGAIVEQGMRDAPFVEGARELLAVLRGRLPLHIVSGMPEIDLLTVLEDRDLSQFFVSAAGSPKTKIDEFRRIMEQGHNAPHSILAIGDSRTEFDAAVELGIPFLAIVADDAPDFFPQDVVRYRNIADLAKGEWRT